MKKFEKIYLDILSKIANKEYPENSLIPSEPKLSQDYQVSRETIRKALKILEEQGYIQKKQGLGSTVLNYQRFALPISGLTSYKELQEQRSFRSETIVIKNELVEAPNHLIEGNLVDENEQMIHLVRLRMIEGEPAIVDEDYIRQEIVEQIPNHNAQESIYQYFEEELGLHIAYASKEIRADQSDESLAELLNINSGQYVINVRSQVFLEDTTFFQYTISHHKLDKFRFHDFARRQHTFLTHMEDSKII